MSCGGKDSGKEEGYPGDHSNCGICLGVAGLGTRYFDGCAFVIGVQLFFLWTLIKELSINCSLKRQLKPKTGE